jgi:hypothetical protein
MKILFSRQSSRRGSILAEACIGLALMSFTWIILTYSIFMADNKIRTAMAARHAAWYKGNGGGNMTGAQLDQYFFYRSGVSKVEYGQGEGMLSAVLSKDAPSFSSGSGWPTKAKVTFGVNDVNGASNPFPFDLLKTKVPFMPDSAIAEVTSVSSMCQWDQDSETWTTPGAALSGIFEMLKSEFSPEKLFSKK